MPFHKENGEKWLVKWKTREMAGDAEGGEQDWRKLSAFESLLSYSSMFSPNKRSRCVCEHVWSFGVRHCSPSAMMLPKAHLTSQNPLVFCLSNCLFQALPHTHIYICTHTCQSVCNSPVSSHIPKPIKPQKSCNPLHWTDPIIHLYLLKKLVFYYLTVCQTISW